MVVFDRITEGGSPGRRKRLVEGASGAGRVECELPVGHDGQKARRKAATRLRLPETGRAGIQAERGRHRVLPEIRGREIEAPGLAEAGMRTEATIRRGATHQGRFGDLPENEP